MANLRNLNPFIFNSQFRASPEQQGNPTLQGKLHLLDALIYQLAKIFAKSCFTETKDLSVCSIKYRIWQLSILLFVTVFASLRKLNKTSSLIFNRNSAVLVWHLTYTLKTPISRLLSARVLQNNITTFCNNTSTSLTSGNACRCFGWRKI